MSPSVASVLVAIVHLLRVFRSQMIIQSCVRDIIVSDLSPSANYPTGANEFYITISADSIGDLEAPQSVNTSKVTLSSTTATAEMLEEICFDFNTTTTATVVSRTPFGATFITFNIMGNSDQFGYVHDIFPNPANGSNKSSFISQTQYIQPANINGTLSYNLYHQIKTENVYLKIANRNFNVYRKCFELKKLCIYPGGIQNPIYPNDCINNNTLTTDHITLQPSDGSEADILDNDDGTTWSPPDGSIMPEGGNFPNCWAPYSQYIIVHLADVNISAFSSISLGFTADVSNDTSGDKGVNNNPPRFITFAFHNNLNDLIAPASDILTDQFWAVDLRDGNFEPEDTFVWTINPLYFQLDTNPKYNKFRMTEITKGFGLQYLRDESLEYRSSLTASTGWYTYAAAYINDPSVANYISSPSTQVQQLAEVACSDIFPTQSPAVSIAYKSGEYNTCWNYAKNQSFECYADTGSSLYIDLIPELFYPPAAYIIEGIIRSGAGWTAEDMQYCVDDASRSISNVDDWGECNVAQLRAEAKNCINNTDSCNRNNKAFVAMPMGWECDIPDTRAPTTADPTTNAPSSSPTTATPTSQPTTYPTFIPSAQPTLVPTSFPTKYPTIDPTKDPTIDPTQIPTKQPSTDPTYDPTIDPTIDPTYDPTIDPTIDPTSDPTQEPTFNPTIEPTSATTEPSSAPSDIPSSNPTKKPSNAPTESPVDESAVDNFNTTEPKGGGSGKGGDEEEGDIPLQWIIIGSCGAICVCCILIGFIFCKKRNKEEEENEADGKSLAEVVAISEVQGTDKGGVQLTESKKVKAEKSSSDSSIAGYYKKPKENENTEIDDLFENEDDDDQHDDIYAKGKRTISERPDDHDDDDIISEGDLEGMKITAEGMGAKQLSLEGGDPHVTGGKYGDPQITKGKSEKLESSSDEDEAGAALYVKGKRGKSKGGPSKVRKKKEESVSSSDSDSEHEKLYEKGNRKSRGGPKYVKKRSEGNIGKGKKKKKAVYKEEAGVKYGDPVVTAGPKANDDSSSSGDFEFDENEQYKM